MDIAYPAATAAALAPYFDAPSLAIVLGGTALALVLRHGAGDLGRAVGALRVLGRRRFRADPLLVQIDALGRIARKHGIMQLDRSVIEDDDVAAAIAVIVDRGEPAAVERLLVERNIARVERHQAAIAVWASVAEIAPAMGMIGTLVGLVKMFTVMGDPRAIGAAMAIALLTTLYGALIATMVGVPIAGRLRTLARAEQVERARLAGPLASLASREQPRLRLAPEQRA